MPKTVKDLVLRKSSIAPLTVSLIKPSPPTTIILSKPSLMALFAKFLALNSPSFSVLKKQENFFFEIQKKTFEIFF